jgi:hypothetical protein
VSPCRFARHANDLFETNGSPRPCGEPDEHNFSS